jgi:hypothetical protein
MQAPSWVALFRQIPSNLHDCLVLITSTNAEVMVQSLLRLEVDYVILRGRMSGTIDGGRVMIVPYDQISNVAFAKLLLERDVVNIFGNNGTTTFAAPIELSKAPKIGEAEEVAEDEDDAPIPGEQLLELPAEDPRPVEQPVAAAPEPTKATPSHPSKSLLLARLRARLAGGPKQ